MHCECKAKEKVPSSVENDCQPTELAGMQLCFTPTLVRVKSAGLHMDDHEVGA